MAFAASHWKLVKYLRGFQPDLALAEVNNEFLETVACSNYFLRSRHLMDRDLADIIFDASSKETLGIVLYKIIAFNDVKLVRLVTTIH
jgi:hypothetical protein